MQQFNLLEKILAGHVRRRTGAGAQRFLVYANRERQAEQTRQAVALPDISANVLPVFQLISTLTASKSASGGTLKGSI